METISRQELKAKLDANQAIMLVMTVGGWTFRAKHIPGSVHFKNDAALFAALAKTDDIVVYCSNVDCHASVAVIQRLREHGYERVAHYPGGIIEWEEAGLPIEGDWAATEADSRPPTR